MYEVENNLLVTMTEVLYQIQGGERYLLNLSTASQLLRRQLISQQFFYFRKIHLHFIFRKIIIQLVTRDLSYIFNTPFN